jgi:hypothetical protein
MNKGPLFTIRIEERQLRVGEYRRPVAILEIREPGPLQGQELWLSERDLDFINFAVASRKGLETLGRYLRYRTGYG